MKIGYKTIDDFYKIQNFDSQFFAPRIYFDISM